MGCICTKNRALRYLGATLLAAALVGRLIEVTGTLIIERLD